MTLGELVRDLSFLNPEWTPSDIEQRARLLREARMLPHAGRGKASPIVTSSDVATLLIALAAAEKAVEVVSVTRLYAALVTEGNLLTGARVFLDAVTTVLNDPDVAGLVREIRVCRSWPEASIVYLKGKKAKRRTESFLHETGRPARRNKIEVAATIHQEILAHLTSGQLTRVELGT